MFVIHNYAKLDWKQWRQQKKGKKEKRGDGKRKDRREEEAKSIDLSLSDREMKRDVSQGSQEPDLSLKQQQQFGDII